MGDGCGRPRPATGRRRSAADGSELELLLERAGFRDVQVYGAYTEAEATVEDEVLVLIGTK